MRLLAVALSSLLLANTLLTGCLFGGGSDTTSARSFPGIIGRVLLASGLPAAGVAVRLIPSDFDPSDTTQTGRALPLAYTSSQGLFQFKTTPTRFYNVLAIDSAGLMGFMDSLKGYGMSDSITLLPPRNIEIHLRDSASRSDSGQVFFPGTNLMLTCESGSPCRSNAVPAQVRWFTARTAHWERTEFLYPQGEMPGTEDTLRIFLGPEGSLE